MPEAPSHVEMLQSLAIALGLGLLVGLQREWVRSRVAGIRTFAFVTVFGALSGLLGLVYGGWVIAAALIAFASMVILGHLAEMKGRTPDIGLTTEMAMLVMFAVGIVTVLGYQLVAVVVAGGAMVLLESKRPLHSMVRRIGRDDLKEIARLVLAGLVILPLLPNRDMGPEGVLNPFSIWLMVVLIVGISLAAYLAGKFLGGTASTALAGILGGLVSSTATTASAARSSTAQGASGFSLAAIALIASSVVFLRVIGEVAVTSPAHLKTMLPPLLMMMAWFGAIAGVTYRFSMKRGKPKPDQAPPSNFKSAVVFGLLYALVLVGVAEGREYFGQSGLYIAASLSGLTDMDAITLSTSRLANAGQIDPGTAWRMILVGGMANVVFKSILVTVLGTGVFVKAVLAGMGASLVGGAAILLFWP